MISVPKGKVFDQSYTESDSNLAKFLMANPSLTQAFENALGSKLGFVYGKIQIFADKAEDFPKIRTALKELEDELKTIPEDRFMRVVNKMKA